MVHDGGGGVDVDGIENEGGGVRKASSSSVSDLPGDMNRRMESWNSD